ncbi:SRPBCC family protein [Knoellia aerolata]|uniref:Carbon monoxide dehydrogenase subunit G (CoxG) family protein n=1 Tax=Knoellia aerolata DSM 18566 TaxID=1385519 RepID=A0A0A0K3Z9_9MICO|nr:SRPBCC family protein [Knoellia aerolata]KGN42987.1 carbon monoxide dehydrogenase subunit G (CoxG) family protein [Knoellia aerolata DSM 18566]
MELHHEFTVPADADHAWETLLDLERVGGCFPGATVTEFSHDGFSGTVKVKLGPISLVYAGSGTFVERDATARRAVIEAMGKDKRGNGTAGATVTLQLSPVGDQTKVEVDTDLAITGKPAQFGRGVMQDVSDKLLRQFVDCIESQFVAPAEDGAAAGVAGVASAQAGDEAEAAGSAHAAMAAASAPVRAPAARRPTPVVDEAIDLGAVALPSAVRQWGPYAVAGLIGILIGYAIGRDRG